MLLVDQRVHRVSENGRGEAVEEVARRDLVNLLTHLLRLRRLRRGLSLLSGGDSDAAAIHHAPRQHQLPHIHYNRASDGEENEVGGLGVEEVKEYHHLHAGGHRDRLHRNALGRLQRGPELDVVFEGEHVEEKVHERHDDRHDEQPRGRLHEHSPHLLHLALGRAEIAVHLNTLLHLQHPLESRLPQWLDRDGQRHQHCGSVERKKVLLQRPEIVHVQHRDVCAGARIIGVRVEEEVEHERRHVLLCHILVLGEIGDDKQREARRPVRHHLLPCLGQRWVRGRRGLVAQQEAQVRLVDFWEHAC
mmetsp:Transcript_57507/g.136793  ORF Transcript_57507/g.136793 Transcript_57507/m.136793 type:complete len:304 (-) Transcript_57507:477-1388(-)